jgi:hypothetical protein
LKEDPKRFYPISLTDRREKEGLVSLVRQKADKVFKMTDFQLIGMAPDEEVGESKFRDDRREFEEGCFEEGLLFERKIFKLRELRYLLP